MVSFVMSLRGHRRDNVPSGSLNDGSAVCSDGHGSALQHLGPPLTP